MCSIFWLVFQVLRSESLVSEASASRDDSSCWPVSMKCGICGINCFHEQVSRNLQQVWGVLPKVIDRLPDRGFREG